MWPCVVRRRAPRVLSLITYLYHLDYGIAVTMSYLAIVFATLHVVWFMEFYCHGIYRYDKFTYLYTQLPIPIVYFEKRFLVYSLHPVYMTIGFNLFQASGMLVFRVCCCYNRSVGVFLHAALTSMAIPFFSFGWIILRGLYVESQWIKSRTTFHSHLGILVFFLTVFQVISGTIVFVILRIFYPYKTAVFRTRFTPYHNFIGYSVYLFSVFAILSGLSHAINFTHPHTYLRLYSKKVLEAEFAYENVVIAMDHYRYIHMTFGITCLFVYYTLAKEDFRHRGRVLAARDNNDDDFYH